MERNNVRKNVILLTASDVHQIVVMMMINHRCGGTIPIKVESTFGDVTTWEIDKGGAK